VSFRIFSLVKLIDSLAVNAPDDEQTNLVGALRETVGLSDTYGVKLMIRFSTLCKALETHLRRPSRLR
jgi:hypothetical protein